MKRVSHIEATATATASGRLRQKWALPLMTVFHLHIMYLRALPVRKRVVFLQILLVASCDMAVAGSAGPQRGRHDAKGTRYVGEIGFIAAMLVAPLASSRPEVD